MQHTESLGSGGSVGTCVSHTGTRAHDAAGCFRLDAQSGLVTTPSGETRVVGATDMVLLYSLALEIPAERVAQTLRQDVLWVEAQNVALKRQLGIDGAIRVDLANGAAPHSDYRWPDRTVTKIILDRIAKGGRDPAVYVSGEGALSMEDVALLVAQIVPGLQREGVGKGTFVAMDASQKLEAYLLVLATLLLGGVVVRYGDTVGPATLRNMVTRAPAQLTFSDRFADIGPDAVVGKRISFSGDDGIQSFEEWIDACPDPIDLDDLDTVVLPSDPAFIGFSTGTTGEPKVVVNSHESVFRASEAQMARFAFKPSDIFCTATDFTSSMALRYMLTLPFLSGARVLLPSREARTQPMAFAMDCETYGVTQLMVTPRTLQGLTDCYTRVGTAALQSVRRILSGSAPLHPHTLKAFHACWPVPVIDWYGAREMSVVVYAEGDMHATVTSGGGRASEVLIRVLREDGTACATGEAGEVYVHTDCLLLDILETPDEDSPVKDGWFRTGDIGLLTNEGRIQLVGRSREVVKTRDGGLVSPVEIEGVLTAHDQIKDVCAFRWVAPDGSECVGVMAVPHNDLSEEASRQLEKDLKAAVHSELGPFKVPSAILFREDLPRLARGKPDKLSMSRDFEAAMAGRASLSQG